MNFSLRTRISLILTGLAASLLLVLALLWLQIARAGIHEEVEAAGRVSVQWLQTLQAPADGAERDALPVLQAMGRVRAHEVQLFAADGQRLYRSPPSTYKQGQAAPAWFAALLTPDLEQREVALGSQRVVLHPDASRSVLDAWDQLTAMAGGALAGLAALFLLTGLALDRALRPLEQVMGALDRTGWGRLDVRLPVFSSPDLARLARAFNGMAGRLAEAVDDNLRLECEREVGRQIQQRLEAERQAIARELHDELAQGITAVRALAGAIVQRSDMVPAVQGPAHSIVAVTGEMQEGVRSILTRLAPAPVEHLADGLERYLAVWRQRHPQLELEARIGPLPELPEPLAAAALRVVQEGLTNILRHAQARHLRVGLAAGAGYLEVTVEDDGQGLGRGPSAQAGCGRGLRGMAERLAMLGGSFNLEVSDLGGCRLRARLPLVTQNLEVMQ